MSRYIDADATKLAVIKATTYGDALRAVKEQPSIDIVRCAECKWRNDYGCHNPIWGDGWANYPSPNPRADDFCSYGERRE